MNEEKKPRSLMRTVVIVVITMILTLVIAALALFSYLLIKNPLNIRGMIFSRWLGENETTQIDSTEAVTPDMGQANSDQQPASNLPISPEQKKALEDVGIDPNAISITPEMEACFIEKLGHTRVEEIKNGSIPNQLDIFKARSCL
jgi:hypothetical protein